MAAYIGLLKFSDPVREKLGSKHGLSVYEVQEAIQWPARAGVAWEDHPVHGRRLLAWGAAFDGAEIIAVLEPIPRWNEDADTWLVRTARKVSG